MPLTRGDRDPAEPGGPDAALEADASSGALFERHGDGLYRYALMILADHAAAEDAVQQAFANLVGRSRARLIRAPLDYLRRAVRNECYTLLRRRVRDIARISSNGLLVEPVSGDPDRPEERLSLDRALRALPAEQREVVHLKMYEGLTFREIAELIDVPPDTAASRYRYALAKLREALARRT